MRTGELYQRYYGHYLATVVDVNDPQNLGRIRVQADQFADTQDQPCWASISRPAAGNQQGVFFTPKNGDQVVLCFVAGDVREPIVVGYAHSTQNAPASVVGTQQHGIVTTVGSMIFDEQNGTITITLVGPTKSVVTMDKDGSKGVKIDFNDGASTAQLDSDGIKLSLQSPPATVTLDSNGIKLDLGGTSTVQLAQSGITIQSTSITLTAPTIAIGDASSVVTVAGQGAVLTDFLTTSYLAHTHTTTAPGAPTGPPVPPAVPAPPLVSSP